VNLERVAKAIRIFGLPRINFTQSFTFDSSTKTGDYKTREILRFESHCQGAQTLYKNHLDQGNVVNKHFKFIKSNLT
jgi:hypothetical protein